MNDLIGELVHELGEFSIDELKEFRIKWIQKLDKMKADSRVKRFASTAIDLIIEKKGGDPSVSGD